MTQCFIYVNHYLLNQRVLICTIEQSFHHFSSSLLKHYAGECFLPFSLFLGQILARCLKLLLGPSPHFVTKSSSNKNMVNSVQKEIPDHSAWLINSSSGTTFQAMSECLRNHYVFRNDFPPNSPRLSPTHSVLRTQPGSKVNAHPFIQLS